MYEASGRKGQHTRFYLCQGIQRKCLLQTRCLCASPGTYKVMMRIAAQPAALTQRGSGVLNGVDEKTSSTGTDTQLSVLPPT